MGSVETHTGVKALPEATSAAIPPREEITEALDKITSSRAFRNAEGQRAFLRYVVEQCLIGNADLIKEYTIGIEVFHRKDSFDPRRDNTVRVKAQKLRWGLLKYYEDEGKLDRVRIDFPTGSYRPSFRYADPAHADAAAPSVEADGSPAKADPTEPVESTEPVALSGTMREAVAEPKAQTLPATVKHESRNLLALLAILLIVALAGTGLVFKYGGKKSPSLPQSPSIVVLPFRILGAEKQEEFFSDGLTEDLTDSLAQIPGLRVVAPSSAFMYKGRDVDIRKVGRDLNVGAVLEGSIQRVNDRVRVTAQLSDTTTGLHIWSSSYDRDLNDVLAIQREISASITGALGVRLGRAGNRYADAARTDPNSVSYQDYLKGRYFLARPSLKNLRTAVASFQQAIAEDAGYAPAYSGLAQAFASMPAYLNSPPTDLIPKIRENATRALELDSGLGEAHVQLALAYSDEFQWAEAEREYRKAIELSPGVAGVHLGYGRYLSRTGRYDEALAELQKSKTLDPVSPSVVIALGRVNYSLHRFDEAARLYRDALDLEPNSATAHEYLSLVYTGQKNYARAIPEMEIAHDQVKDNVWYQGILGYELARAGNSAAAQQILNQLLHQAEESASPAMAIAHVYLGLGNGDEALRWLKKAVDSKNANAPAMKSEPIYDPLRSDPRFNDLLHQMNMN